MTLPSTVDERNANLDALKAAADAFFSEEEKRINRETQFLRSVLQGRGQSSVGARNLAQAAELLDNAVSEFLVVSQ